MFMLSLLLSQGYTWGAESSLGKYSQDDNKPISIRELRDKKTAESAQEYKKFRDLATLARVTMNDLVLSMWLSKATGKPLEINSSNHSDFEPCDSCLTVDSLVLADSEKPVSLTYHTWLPNHLGGTGEKIELLPGKRYALGTQRSISADNWELKDPSASQIIQKVGVNDQIQKCPSGKDLVVHFSNSDQNKYSISTTHLNIPEAKMLAQKHYDLEKQAKENNINLGRVRTQLRAVAGITSEQH